MRVSTQGNSSMRSGILAIVGALSLASVLAHAQDEKALSNGSYRLQGKCESSFYLGAMTAPQCQSYMGISVEAPNSPMFIFPLANGAWFFVTNGRIDDSKDQTTYRVSKLYDESLKAEFAYPEGECTVSPGPKVSCRVWKDGERKVLARELSFSGSGEWAFSKGKQGK